MAAPLKVVSQISRLSGSLTRCGACQRIRHQYSTSSQSDSENQRVPPVKVGMSADNNTILFWHPEPEHPYEYTKPLPRTQEAKQGDSVLKVQLLKEETLKYRSTGPTTPELTRLTFTTKHRWLPKPEKKYKKRNPPKDRHYV